MQRSSHHARLEPEAGATQCPHGFSLIELVVSLAIMSILVVAMGSAMIFAGQAMPDRDVVHEARLRADDALAQILEELSFALHFTERTATSVAFTVPDRDGDGSPEHIRYSWSGTPGDSLMRAYNHAADSPILAAVTDLDFAYDTTSHTHTYPGPLIEQPESLLASHTASNDLRSWKVTTSDWIGQYLPPASLALGPDAVAWRLSRAEIRVRSVSVLGLLATIDLQVQLRDADPVNRIPTTNVLADRPFADGALLDLGGYQWVETTFPNAPAVPASRSVALTVISDDSDGGYVRYDDDTGSTDMVETNNGDSNWQDRNSEAMHHYVYGHVLTPGPDKTLTRDHVTAVRVNLLASDDPAARIGGAARCLNAPAVLDQVWELDFNHDPTVIDHNGDTFGDWVLDGGSSTFNTGTSLSDGKWIGNGSLDTRPLSDFDQPLTVYARFQCTGNGSEKAQIVLNTDFAGGKQARLTVELWTPSSNVQTLELRMVDVSGSSSVSLVQVPNLPDELLDVRLIVDPDDNTVHLSINGRDHGTFVYEVFDATADRFLSLVARAHKARFDHVSIRMGGTGS